MLAKWKEKRQSRLTCLHQWYPSRGAEGRRTGTGTGHCPTSRLPSSRDAGVLIADTQTGLRWPTPQQWWPGGTRGVQGVTAPPERVDVPCAERAVCGLGRPSVLSRAVGRWHQRLVIFCHTQSSTSGSRGDCRVRGAEGCSDTPPSRSRATHLRHLPALAPAARAFSSVATGRDAA